MKKKQEFVKVKCGNDWGSLYYCYKEGQENISLHSRDIGPGLRERLVRATVRWPDGRIDEKVKITTGSHYETVSDHGSLHSTGVSSVTLEVAIEHHGLDLTVDLSKVEIDKNSLVFKVIGQRM